MFFTGIAFLIYSPWFFYNLLMKYAIVIPDGAADEPQDNLGGKTPLQAARLPNMDRVARIGVVGRMDNVPRPLTPASDVVADDLRLGRHAGRPAGGQFVVADAHEEGGPPRGEPFPSGGRVA